jgi:hypothetical protein
MGDKERLITHQWGWMDVDRTWEDDARDWYGYAE